MTATKDLPSPVPPSKETRPGSRVSFTQVQIREYEQIIGDAPFTCIGAPPISIGWEYFEEWTAKVEEFELARKAKRRARHEMLMPSLIRIERLMEHGYSRTSIYRVMQQRRQEAAVAARVSTDTAWKILLRAWQKRQRRKEDASLRKCTEMLVTTAAAPTNEQTTRVGILKDSSTTATANSLPNKRSVVLLKGSPKDPWIRNSTQDNDASSNDTEEESDNSLTQGTIPLRHNKIR